MSLAENCCVDQSSSDIMRSSVENFHDCYVFRESMVSESSSEPVAMTVGNVVILDEITYHQMLDDITSLKKSLTDLWDLLSIQVMSPLS